MRSSEAIERAGITYRQADYWCRANYIRIDSNGSGEWREWSDIDVAVASVLGRFMAFGGKGTFIGAISDLLYSDLRWTDPTQHLHLLVITPELTISLVGDTTDLPACCWVFRLDKTVSDNVSELHHAV